MSTKRLYCALNTHTHGNRLTLSIVPQTDVEVEGSHTYGTHLINLSSPESYSEISSLAARVADREKETEREKENESAGAVRKRVRTFARYVQRARSVYHALVREYTKQIGKGPAMYTCSTQYGLFECMLAILTRQNSHTHTDIPLGGISLRQKNLSVADPAQRKKRNIRLISATEEVVRFLPPRPSTIRVGGRP